MVTEYVNDIARQMNVPVSGVTTVEGARTGCLGVHLLNISFKGKAVSALMYQKELEDLQNSVYSDRLELKVRSALLRLQLLLAP
jgi:hypothetical protein